MRKMPSAEGERRGFRALVIAMVAAVVAALVAVAAWRILAMHGIDITALTPADVETFVRSWGSWGAVGSVGLMVLHSFLPLPAEIISIANGMLFGAWLGIALTWLGAMLGAVLSFALARWLGRPFLRLVVAERQWRRIDALPVSKGALLVARLVPVISFNLVNYAAGILGVGWWTFLWTTAMGILPLTIVTVLVGDRFLAMPLWIWALTALAFLAPWLIWRQRHR